MDNTKLEFEFEFESETDFRSTLERELRFLGGYIGDLGVLTLNSNGLPLFGETIVEKPAFKTLVTITLWKRGGGFASWTDLDGSIKVFQNKEVAEKYRADVVARCWKGRSSVNEDSILVSKGKCHYSISSDTYAKLKKLRKEHRIWVQENPKSFDAEILSVEFEDERDNETLDKIKASLRRLEKIEAEKAVAEVAKWEAQRKLEAERMRYPLYRIFRTIESWNVDDDEEFKKLESLSSRLHEAAEESRNRPADFYSVDRGRPSVWEHDWTVYGDPGWYDE